MQTVDNVVDVTLTPTEPEAKTLLGPASPEPAPPGPPLQIPERQKWNPVLTALGGLYLVSAASHLLTRPDLLGWLMVGGVALTGMTLIALRWLFNLKNLSAGRLESISAILAGLVLINTLYHLYYLSDAFETVNLALLGLGIASFFLPCARLTLVLVCTLAVWVIVAWSTGTTPAWLHFAFGLFAASGLRLHTEFRQSGMKAAYAAAESEITKRKEVEQALRESEARYALAAEGSNDGLWDWDLRRHSVYFSPRWRGMIGFEGEEIGEHPSEWLHRVHPTDRPKVRNALLEHIEAGSPHFEAEYRILHRDGNYRWMLSRGLAVRDADGKAYRIAGSQTDVTARKLAEEQLLHDAFHDHLTGLPNRALFIDRLESNLKRRSRSSQYLFALLFLDLDRFKIVNDSLGHLAGDLLLKILAKRLEASIRSVDTVARFGGDEFAVLLSDLREPGDAIVVAERIQKGLQIPFPLEEHQVFTTASIGIVVSSPDYQYADEMLRDADTAMYRAKMRGKGSYELFNGEMLCNTRGVLQMENDLRNALRRREFVLHYQPIIYLQTGKIAGFEALIRWNHPERGLLAPGQFLAVAEDADLLVPIGWQTLEEGCGQLQRWRKGYPGHKNLGVAVNLSAKQFSCPDLVEKLDKILAESGLDPAYLKLEITEGIVMQSVDSSLRILGQLREKGIHLHLDDFGTGYSALSYLHQFPVSTLKTDRSFITRRGSKKENRAVLQAVVQMASDLGMDVVVEGVETPEQFAEVMAMDCKYGQGYLFSRPVDPATAERLLAEDKDLRPAACLKNLPMFADYQAKAAKAAS
ncbi:MAG: EAL domain-containing protein [Acidobacteria bacterium]|nr:MAG: EAL domain-containing protein [Acidobacteriota bacterium]